MLFDLFRELNDLFADLLDAIRFNCRHELSHTGAERKPFGPNEPTLADLIRTLKHIGMEPSPMAESPASMSQERGCTGSCGTAARPKLSPPLRGQPASFSGGE